MSGASATVGTTFVLEIGGRVQSGQVVAVLDESDGRRYRVRWADDHEAVVDDSSFCSLGDLFGAVEACSGAHCPFWVDAEKGGSCELAPLAAGPDRPVVERFLRDVRHIVENVGGTKSRFAYHAEPGETHLGA